MYFKTNIRQTQSYPPKLLSGFFEGDVFTGFYHGIHHHFFITIWDNIILRTLSFCIESSRESHDFSEFFPFSKPEPFFQGKISHLRNSRGIEGNMPIITQLIEAKVQLAYCCVLPFCLGEQYTLLGGTENDHHAYLFDLWRPLTSKFWDDSFKLLGVI